MSVVIVVGSTYDGSFWADYNDKLQLDVTYDEHSIEDAVMIVINQKYVFDIPISLTNWFGNGNMQKLGKRKITCSYKTILREH